MNRAERRELKRKMRDIKQKDRDAVEIVLVSYPNCQIDGCENNSHVRVVWQEPDPNCPCDMHDLYGFKVICRAHLSQYNSDLMRVPEVTSSEWAVIK